MAIFSLFSQIHRLLFRYILLYIYFEVCTLCVCVLSDLRVTSRREGAGVWAGVWAGASRWGWLCLVYSMPQAASRYHT